MRGGVRVKKSKGSNHLTRNIILAVLLAVLCIGGVELAACRHFAPEAYDRIVAPARYAATVAADTGKAAVDAAGHFFQAAGTKARLLAAQAAQQAGLLWERLTARPEGPLLEEVEIQKQEPEPAASYHPPAGDPLLTELREEDGKQILTGGAVDMVYYCQADEEWASQPFGTDPIGPYGCGPTAMAMVVASMTDTDTNPAQMAAWAAEHGYWARQSGSYHSIIQGTARAFGLEAEAISERTVEEMRRELSYGHVLAALVGPGHFTKGGHFILIRGVTLTGDVLVADPNSLERSLEVWDPQIILDELSSARDNGAPLWVLSEPGT